MSTPPPADRRPEKTRLFLSYGRADAGELVDRLESDLSLLGFEVWRDRREIRSGKEWDDAIEAGLRASQLVVAVLTPHAVREESVCRDELAFARFACKLPIVPALAEPCVPPFVIFRLDYIDLTAWRDSADQYKLGFKRLIEAVQAHLRGGPPRYRRWDNRFPHFDFGPYLYDKRRDFCGREWLFQRIDAWRADGNRQRALLITGDPGIGKSAIVAQLVHMNPGGQVLAYHCCRADTPETLRPGRFIRGLAGMIASQLDAYASQLDDPRVEAALGEARCETDPASAFEEGIINPLHKVPAPAGGVRYILIDALDEALALREGLSIVTLLSPSRLDRLPGWLRVVATSRKDPDVLRQLSGLRAEEIWAEAPAHLGDIERFLAHRLSQPELASRLFPAGDAPAPLTSPLALTGGECHGEGAQSRAGRAERISEIVRKLRDKSAGNFLWAQQALLGIERDQYQFDRLDRLPPGLDGLYLDFFQRQFPDKASYEAPGRVLHAVAAAAEPLSAADLAGATGLDPEDVLPATLRSLAAFLPERDGRYVLHHKSLADWLTDPANRGTLHYASPTRGHERLAQWCWDEYRRGPERMSPYALRHLPVHLVAAARWDNLAAVLRALRYLEARAEAGQVFDLAMDFTRAGERLPDDHPARRHLRLIEQALRSDLHFLARHPATLFQCLWNRCWWYDCPEAAAHYDPPPGGWPAAGPPWARPASERLAQVLESWRVDKERRMPTFPWARSRRPPPFPLGGAELACLRGHTRPVEGVAFSPDGRRVVSGSYDQTVRVWDAQTGAELACLRGHTDNVASVALSPDGRRLVSGSHDQTVRVWDAQTGAELAYLRGHTRGVLSVAFSPDGRRVVSGSLDRTARVWDAGSGACLEVIQGWGDVNTIAAGGDRVPWRAVARGLETMIEPAAGGDPVACFSAALDCITTQPAGRCWAGRVGSYLFIIELEGEPGPTLQDTTR